MSCRNRSNSCGCGSNSVLGTSTNSCGCRRRNRCGCRNNSCGNSNSCGCDSSSGVMGTSTNSWSDTGCGCQKTGTFVDYMPVVVNYTVTPTDYDVLGTSTCTDSSGVLGTSTGNGRGCRNSTSSGCC